METVTTGTFLRSKQTVTVAINFLNWLHGRDVTLADVQQADLDLWVNAGTTTHLIIDRFLRWAVDTGAAPSGVTVTRHRRGTSKKLSAEHQEKALADVIDGSGLSDRDRAAAILVLVFGQQLERVVGLTWDDVAVTEDLVTVSFGRMDIVMPEPLDGPWRELAANPGHNNTAAHAKNRWVFRGQSPGGHISAERLRHQVASTRAARLGTLHELTKLAPVAIIAETLGYGASTIERHAAASGADYARYVGSIVNRPAPRPD